MPGEARAAVGAADHRGRQQFLAQHVAKAVGDDDHREDQHPDRQVAQGPAEPMPAGHQKAADEAEQDSR